MVVRRCSSSPTLVIGLFLETEFTSFEENYLEITRITITEATRGLYKYLESSADLTTIILSTNLQIFFCFPHHYFFLACLYCQAVHSFTSICFIFLKHSEFLVNDMMEKSRNHTVCRFLIYLTTPQIKIG